MNLKRMLLFVVLICSVSLFIGCSSDDDNKSTSPIENQFDGVYKGTLDVEVGAPLNTTIKDIPQKIYITKSGENKFKLELKNFSFEGMPIGDIVVNDITAKPINKTKCTFEGSSNLALSIGQCNVNVEGDIVGDKTDIEIIVAVANPQMTVKVEFEGTKLAKDQSSEAKILSFTFDSPIVTQQPIIDSTRITIFVSETATSEEIAQLVPTITVSEKATFTPASGVAQNFNQPVVYTVTSEDGIVQKEFVATIGGKSNLYDFEEWVKGVQDQEPDMTFYEVANGWSSSNTGAHFLKAFGMADSYVVTQSTDAKSGNTAARIETIDTKGADMGFVKVPKVTAGSLFTGTFVTDIANTLKSTKFGNPCLKEPIALAGYYKYTPGKTFYRCESPATCNVTEVDTTSIDECSINAVLYEVSTFDDPKYSEYLTGMNIYTSDKIVATAQLADGTEKKEYTSFYIPFNFVKKYDATKKYRLAIICSSSKDGDKFNGAPGSVLLVDDFKLITE